MLKRLLNMFLLILSMLSVIVILVSPSLLFSNGDLRMVRRSFSKQKVSPKRLFINSWRTIKMLYIDSSMNHQDWNKWKKRYLKKIETDDDVVVAVNTMLASLNDKNSEFFNTTKFQLQSNIMQDTDESSNILSSLFPSVPSTTVYVTTIAGIVSKVQVIEDSKGYKEPKLNDEIVKIDGYPLLGLEMNAARKLIEGKNITQRLEIIRNNKHLTVTALRGSMAVNKIDSKMLPNDVLLIHIHSLLSPSSPSSLLELLNNSEIKGVIIDLRGNVGGLFPNAISIADIFIEKGTIATIKYRNKSKIEIKALVPCEIDNIENKPIVILVDQRTASACEILAGALKYNNRAILVGGTTYGKNSVQQIVPMHNNMGMNVTIAHYLLGLNQDIDINMKGIEPDYKVDITYKDILNRNDKQLNKAIKVINEEIKKRNINKD